MKASGLRGRGGAGFLCGVKWERAHSINNSERYLICNADEGEVGTFKDRTMLEQDPFSLEELVYEYAGARDVQMAQVGGGGRIVPVEKIGLPLTYETALGSGAVIVMDRQRDPLEIIHCGLEFFAEESCGKCAPCREGAEVLLDTLNRIRKGNGVPGDLQAMEELGTVMRMSSLCGLGQAAPVPLLDSLKYYRSVYESRIAQSMFLLGLSGY